MTFKIFSFILSFYLLLITYSRRKLLFLITFLKLLFCTSHSFIRLTDFLQPRSPELVFTANVLGVSFNRRNTDTAERKREKGHRCREKCTGFYLGLCVQHEARLSAFTSRAQINVTQFPGEPEDKLNEGNQDLHHRNIMAALSLVCWCYKNGQLEVG